MTDEAEVTRAEFEVLLRRVERLEARIVSESRREAPPAAAPPPAATSRPATIVTHSRPPPAAARPPSPAPAPAPTPAHAPAPTTASFFTHPAPTAPSKLALESLMGARLAPRVGAVLVFLASLFFLGVGVQRGWIGPLAQLGIALAASAALLIVAHVLNTRRGYGQYPEILEGTAACIAYATAFAAHALPYYAVATGLNDIGGAILMALMAAGTVGLAFWRDSRIIISLGYVLSFLTAALTATLPALTIPYVGILGASLAVIVAKKGWLNEAVLGTIVTGAFFAYFAFDAATPPPGRSLVLGTAAIPFAAFVWTALHTRTAEPRGEPALIAFFTLAWGALASALAFAPDVVAVGIVFAVWCAAALALAITAGLMGARKAAGAFGFGAVALYLLAPAYFWSGHANGPSAITLTYAVGALAIAMSFKLLPRGARQSVWNAGLLLATFAAYRALVSDQLLRPRSADLFGPIEVWSTFLLLAPAFAALMWMAPSDRTSTSARAALLFGFAYIGLSAFTLFHSVFLTTAYLLVIGALIATLAQRNQPARTAKDALVIGLAFVFIAAGKIAVYDTRVTETVLPVALAALESVVAAGVMLALYHTGARRVSTTDAGPLLVGGSAVVLGAFVLAYGVGPWKSVLLAALGLAYLASGFAMRSHAIYRLTGIAALGFTVSRVLAVDMRGADLVVRAAVFAVLGLVLLVVGYVYARMNRSTQTPLEEPTPE